MLLIKSLGAFVLPLVAVALPSTPTAKPVAGLTYQKNVLEHHNIHRSNHSATNVTWSASLLESAYALAKTCKWGHNTMINGGGYGQNLAAGIPASNVAAAITNMFYNGEMSSYAKQYGKPTPNMTLFGDFGHFTQVVWKGTKQVGCATYDCTAKKLVDAETKKPLLGIPPYYTVCNYAPSGNYMGQFNTNVGRPLGQDVVEV